MEALRIDGVLLVREQAAGPVYYAKWRDSTRTQVMRKLGRAWVERHGDGWRKRRGVMPAGCLTPHGASERMRTVIDAHELELVERRTQLDYRRQATFADVAWACLLYTSPNPRDS